MAEAPSAWSFRAARRKDVPAVVRLLADDPLGRERETSAAEVPAAYWRAFEEIERDPRNLLVVTELAGEIVATLQLTFIPSMTYRGAERAQIEGVRVSAAYRNRGLGRVLLGWAVDHAQARGCRIVQLTADQRRPDALRFYQSLGFRPTHQGLKLFLE
jgi:GNAT superfamily N-acetyltransferase